MDEKLAEYFVREVRRRSANPVYLQIANTVAFAAQNGELDVRADAVYFIANNLYDMVWEPVSAVSTNDRETLELVGAAIRTDARTLLEASEALARRSGRKEVTANSTALALAEVIERLMINSEKLKLWGRKD